MLTYSSGFTGVLAGVCHGVVKLITDIGAPPACPIGSSCDGWACDCVDGCAEPFKGPRGYNWGWRGGNGGCGRWGWGGFNWLGSVTEIPIERIASFTHNAI